MLRGAQTFKKIKIGPRAFLIELGSVRTDWSAVFDHFRNKLVDYARIHKGAAILDIPCGRGSSLFPAFEKAGPLESATGIDLSRDMLLATLTEVNRRKLSGISLAQMDAERLLFHSESFDSVLCGLALFFFPNLDQSLSEIYRVLKPEGVFVTSIFGEEDRRWDVVGGLVDSYQDALKEAPRTERKKLNKPPEIIECLTSAGLAEVKIYAEEKEFHYREVEEWWSSAWPHGGRALLERLEDEDISSFRREALQLVQEIEDEKGIPSLLQVLIARAC